MTEYKIIEIEITEKHLNDIIADFACIIAKKHSQSSDLSLTIDGNVSKFIFCPTDSKEIRIVKTPFGYSLYYGLQYIENMYRNFINMYLGDEDECSFDAIINIDEETSQNERSGQITFTLV